LAWVERVVRTAFGQRRKTLVNCLRAGGGLAGGDRDAIERALAAVGIDARERAERVEPRQLLALARALA